MKPKFFAVYYAMYESDPASRHSYNVGDLYLCKVLDNPLFTLRKRAGARGRVYDREDAGRQVAHRN